LANNLITLFVFWELTSLSSYLLIGFDHERAAARAAALQALLVTGAGGLALLAGLLLLGQVGNSLELSLLVSQGAVVRSHAFYVPILFLILIGAFTKSAQFPFHFWLPAAMEAPTPVSAYLHSATMVKAGVYLLARLSPILGGAALWQYLVTGGGIVTMVVGAYLAWQQHDLKRILAYSTVSALGTLMLLIGLGTALAIQAAIVFLLVHSLYKGTLFLVAGAVDHETGTRDVAELGGLRQTMPITAGAAGLAALSMAGLPPLFGFMGKELFYEATLHSYLLLPLAVLANMLLVAVAGTVGLRPFLGIKTRTPKEPHEAPPSLWLGPILLTGLSLIAGIFPNIMAATVVSPAITAVFGQPAVVKLALWHGVNLVLVLSVITALGGVMFYVWREAFRQKVYQFAFLTRWGPEQWYTLALDGLNTLASLQTRWLQNGYLRFYMLLVIITTVGLSGYTLLSRVAWPGFGEWPAIRFYEWVVAIVILLAALTAVRSPSRLGAVAALGVVGYGVALIFILFGAPDLAMTQFSIETLMVILFVLVLYRLPRYASFTTTVAHIRDAIVALVAGGLITVLILMVTSIPLHSRLAPYFAENSVVLAKGRNIVNVILVDFRGLDTFGEITVLAVAALGVYALLKLRLRKEET
jgi:multicomponent Na+:H+ antiporter subunit A